MEIEKYSGMELFPVQMNPDIFETAIFFRLLMQIGPLSHRRKPVNLLTNNYLFATALNCNIKWFIKPRSDTNPGIKIHSFKNVLIRGKGVLRWLL